jgi:hypothetical protein
VLAVDVPSGVARADRPGVGPPLAADRTITFGGAQAGLLFHPGRALAGEVEVADIGLDVLRRSAGLVEAIDVAGGCPPPDGAPTSGRPRCCWWPGRGA